MGLLKDFDTAPRLTVAQRFCGPPSSANGGYICGLIAGCARRPVTVRLSAPPPLGAPLDVVERAGRLEVEHDGVVVAQAREGGVGELAVPSSPTREEAVTASRAYAGFGRHPAPTCFVCGPRRAEADGLSIFPGLLPSAVAPANTDGSDGTVAAPWTPDASLDAGDGSVAPEFVWAALDCPGYVAVAPDMRHMLLGELTAEILRSVRVGTPHVVLGWGLGSSGRKHTAGTALYDADGRLCARARAIWIEPRQVATPA